MSDFAPGFDSMRAAGVPVTRAPYADGSAGIRQSLETMALKMREGRVDAAIIGWTGKVLKDAGLDGRDRATTPALQAAALLDALREATVYAPDAYGAEVIQSAAGTLCLRPGLCLNRGDCDDLTVALGSATLSIGIPTLIVKQNFGADKQEHVLLMVHDGNDWRYADPSTNLPFGSGPHAVSEITVDPMDPIGTLPAASPEIVTLGRPTMGIGAEPRPAKPPPPTPHWPTGLGEFLGYPTVQDLVELLNTAAYNIQQIQAALATCPNGFTDAAEWSAWQTDYNALLTDFNSATTYVNVYIGDQPQALWPYSVVFYPWDLVRGIVSREIDLDRRWRKFGANCAAPTYPNTPQPSVSPDLWALQAADTALKNVKAAADAAAQPVVIGTVGIVVGAALAVGTLLYFGMAPTKRPAKR